MKNIHIYRIIQLLLLCFVFNVSYAQNSKNLGTKISDKVEVQPDNLKSNSILELESKAKGFLLPRMTTAERNQINVNASNSTDTGLAIFNIDNDCVEYYTAISKKWVSLCGTLPPAKIDFNGDCAQLLITKPGDFKFVAGNPITGRNVQVTVPIKINEAGTYQVDVYSRKDGKSNGYYFSTTGTFLSKGTIEVAIIGQGTPLDGYDDVNQGDTFVVNLNGVEVLTCSSKQHVEKAATKYKIVENSYFVKGSLYLGVPATAANTVDIAVDVEGVGKYTIESIGEGVNGISLFGSGEFTKTGSNTVTLRAAGIPTGSGIQGDSGFNIPIKTNSGLVGSVPTGTKVIAKVTPTKLAPQCANITAVGKYIKGSAIDLKDNLLRVPVKVVAPGKTSLKMVSTDGFVFKSDEQNFTFDANKDNITEVVLRPESKVIPFTLTHTDLTFEANSALDITGCSPFRIEFEQPAVDYEIENCNIIPRSKNFPVAKPLPVEKYGIDVNVKVKIAGPYAIATTDLSNSGVSFTASGVFKVEDQGKVVQVTLVPSGEYKGDPNVSTPYNYSIYKNIEQSEVCNFKINAGLRSIGILDLGTYTADLSTSFGPNYYGEDGKYATVLEVNYFDKTFKELLGSKSNEEAKIALEKFIVDNEIDIVLLQFGRSETWATISGNKNVVMDVLVDFVKARKITMIYYGQSFGEKEQSNSRLENMINYIGHKFYPNDSQAPKWNTKPYVSGQSSGRDQFFGKFAIKSDHRYLNPKAFMNEKLMPKEKIDPKGKTYIMSRGSFSFIDPVSDNFIILTERTKFESNGKSLRGYTGYTLKDYPVVVLNGVKEYYGHFDNGAPKVVSSSIAIYDNMNKIDTYNSYFFTAVISEMIEQIKEGL